MPGLTACGDDDDDKPEPVATPTPPGAPADVKAEITLEEVASAIRLDSRFAGLSYEKHRLTVPMFTGTNLALIRLFRLLGHSVLRIGANAVDRASWNASEPGLTPILPAQIDDLAAFLKETQWQLIYGVNLVDNTPANAAREAAYVAQRLGGSLLAWEIGNEPDLYRRNGVRPANWSYEDFLKEWRQFRDAMSAASPGVPFSGPATSFDVARYTVLFARDAGDEISMLTHHYYRADRNDPNSTLQLLLEPDDALVEELAVLVPAAARQGIEQGLRLAEANSFYNGGVANVSNAFGTGLWVMDFMFICALAGCTGVNMHSGGSGPGYTPIADRDGSIVEARPEFYGMLMFALAGPGLPLRGRAAIDARININGWGVRRDDGGLNVVLLNKDDRRSVAIGIATGGAARFDPLWLRGTSLSASTGQTLGGVPIGSDGSWIPQAQEPLDASNGRLDVVLPPFSALLLRSL